MASRNRSWGIATQMVVEENLLKKVWIEDIRKRKFIKVWEWKKESGGLLIIN